MNGLHELFSLDEIAGWSRGDATKNVLAEVPILQRGLVWDQSQIELLWDSILRDIPVGSLVLCKKTKEIENQSRKEKQEESSHYIIDGQQRCNAISLGFSSFPKEESTELAGSNESILWLDLDTNFEKVPGSTREFLVRLTTPAHPWGFNKSDDCGRLSVGTIRGKIEEIKGASVNFAEEKRPKPSQLYPFDANTPIPISILLNANESEFWQDVVKKLEDFGNSRYQWATKAVTFIKGGKIDKQKIENAIRRAKSTKIIAIQAPDVLFKPTSQEVNHVSNTGITNIEHLFQRLNRQGTVLDGEELIYSMMKSYLPEIAEKIDEAAKGRMLSSKLVQLSVRLALSDEMELKGAFNVSQIRKIASSEDEARKIKVVDFINNELTKIVETVDKWLLFDETNKWGLPKVLKTGIAMSSPDVYCLLMAIARTFPDLDEITRNRIIGIALFIHWFIDDKGKAVKSIYQQVCHSKEEEDKLWSNVKQILKSDGYIKNFLPRLEYPESLEKIIEFRVDNLPEWNWSKCFTEIDDVKKGNINALLIRMKSNKEFLLYAQRGFLEARFPDYDPARKDLWKNINRPWDFDHILPQVFVRGKWDTNAYKRFCDEWVNTNGNLRAWPFEDNRSDQRTETAKKMKEHYWHDSFISDDERSGYSDEQVINDLGKALAFGNACRSRIIRIYKEWFDAFHFRELLEEVESSVNKEQLIQLN